LLKVAQHIQVNPMPKSKIYRFLLSIRQNLAPLWILHLHYVQWDEKSKGSNNKTSFWIALTINFSHVIGHGLIT